MNEPRWKTLSIILAVLALALGTITVAAAQSSGAESGRLAGTGRIDTAIEISQHAFPEGSLEVYIANAALNPDALVGGALTKGPILLVPECGDLPGSVAQEIQRLSPFRVLALGGSAVVCDSMLQQAADAAPAPQDRPDQTIERSGSGEGASTPFELNGGSYLVEYSYDGECFYGPFLEPIDDQGQNESLPSGDGPTSGSTHIHNVVPGEYAIDMISGSSPGCPWTITLTSDN